MTQPLLALLLAAAAPDAGLVVDVVVGAADGGVRLVETPLAAEEGVDAGAAVLDRPTIDAPPGGPPASTAKPPAADVVGLPVVEVRVRLPSAGRDDATIDEERAQLERYLQDFVGRAVATDTLADAQDRLLRLGRFRAAVCRAGAAPGGAVVVCSLTRARTIRDVVVQGLPGALLEQDLMKRVFLRRGEPLERKDATGRNRIPRQRERIEDYLVREGFWGAEVKILTPRAQQADDVDVVVRIRGGSFVKVRNVDIRRFGPLSQEEIERSFGRMCLSAAGLLDALFVGTLSCFSRERLRDAIEHFDARLVELGHPEGRVRVDVAAVDPRRKEGFFDDCAFTGEEQTAYAEAGLQPPPRCVDLIVDVDSGPKLDADVVLAPARGEAVPDFADPPFAADWAVLAWDNLLAPASRIVAVVAGSWQQPTWDSTLFAEDLAESFTFAESSAVDETEAQLSAAALQDKLGTRGYPLARVEAVRTEPAPGQVDVRFVVDAGPALWIRRVRFVGNTQVPDDVILDEVELAARPRALQTSGFVSLRELEDDETRLREMYSAKGFPEAVVESEIVRTGLHTIDVVFRIDEGERFTVAAVEIVGGEPSLGPAVLSALVHCVGPDGADEDRIVITGAQCAGSPFLPDELEAERQRVLNVYAEAGYAHVDADVAIGFTEKGTVLRVTVKPTQDAPNARPKRARIGEIFVEGAVQTDRDVLLRELDLHDEVYGAPLDPVAVAEGVSRLRRTGLYSRVQLDYLGLDDPDTDVVHVRLRVEERPATTVDASLGFSSERLAGVRAEARHRNVLGWMLDASALVEMGLFIGRWSEAAGQVRWPRMRGTDLTSSITARATYEDAPAGLRRIDAPVDGPVQAIASWHEPDVRRRELQASMVLALDWKLTDEITTGVSYELGGQKNNLAAEPIAPFSAEAFQTIDGLTTAWDEPVITIGAITPRVAWNNVDNPFDPERGAALDAFLRVGAPWIGARAYLGVLGVGARGYWTTWERVTWAGGLRLRWGVIDEDRLCPTEHPSCGWVVLQRDLLRLGGQRSIRGYPQDSIGPLSLPLNARFQAQAQDPAPRPGLFGAVANLEMRVLVVRNFFLGDVKVVPFVDVGATTDDPRIPAEIPGAPSAPLLERLKADPRFGVSVGTGLRYVMPVGPASLDCAISPIHEVGGFNRYGCELLFGYIF